MSRPAVNVAVRAARAAGTIILRYLNRVEGLAVEEKARHDYVSEVDRLAKAEIIRELKRAFPAHAMLGEERHPAVGDPAAFQRAQHGGLDQPAVERRQGERLEAEERPGGAGERRLMGQQQILDPDAVGAGEVVARLVGQDHAGLDGHGQSAWMDAAGALVHAKIAADAMAGAMIVIEPGLPERRACEAV